MTVEAEAGVARLIVTFCAYYGVGKDEALARLVTEAGHPVGQLSVSNYKRGVKSPPLRFVVGFVKALDLSPEHRREFLRAYMRENPEYEDFLRLWSSL